MKLFASTIDPKERKVQYVNHGHVLPFATGPSSTMRWPSVRAFAVCTMLRSGPKKKRMSPSPPLRGITACHDGFVESQRQ